MRELCRKRDRGACVRHERAVPAVQLHHRRPRAYGGGRDCVTNCPANLIWLCLECHIWVESYRRLAYKDGFLLKQHQSPLVEPVLYRGVLSLLTEDGLVEEVAA